MKKIAIYFLSSIVLVALVIGLLPPVAAESQNDSMAGSDYQPLTTQAGERLAFTISASDSDNDTLIYSASNLPPGATFDPQTRTFSWTPGYDQAGIYPDIHFEVSDGELADSEDITITVINVDRPPVLDFIGDKLVKEEEFLEFIVNADDPDNEPLVYSASNLPPGAIFDSQTRTFSWKPGSGQRANYPGVHFEASDGKLADSEDITITVTVPEEDACSVSGLKINPTQVGIGKKVNIRVFATNSGTVSSNFEVTLRINGIIEDNRILNLDAGATEEVKFVTYKDVLGVYAVDVNGLRDSFVVKETQKGHAGGRGNPKKSIFLKSFGWIRTMLQKGGDV